MNIHTCDCSRKSMCDKFEEVYKRYLMANLKVEFPPQGKKHQMQFSLTVAMESLLYKHQPTPF